MYKAGVCGGLWARLVRDGIAGTVGYLDPNRIMAQNMQHIRPIYTIFLTISDHFPTHSFERYSNKNKPSRKNNSE